MMHDEEMESRVDTPPPGWWLREVMKKSCRGSEWVALMYEKHPADFSPGEALGSCWVNIPGKHRSHDRACDVFESMRATKH